MPISSPNTKSRIHKGSTNSLLHVEILERDGNWRDLKNIRDQINRVMNVALQNPKISIQSQSEVCIVLSNDKEVQNLNLTFRRKNCATNVLSFPSRRKDAIGDLKTFLGDIVLAQETIKREANEANIPFVDHLSHLTLHGFLHLMGYNHKTERQASTMEGLEVAILSRLGISDPYKLRKSPRHNDKF